MTNIDMDETYTFEVTESTIPDYRMCASISQWIYSNLENITDDNDHKLFNKVNYGYNEETLKSFGKKPVADIYIDHVEYSSDLRYTKPETAHSIIILHVKGANDKAYLKACQLHDYIMQKYIDDMDWRELEDIVRDTIIVNSEIMNHPRNGWSNMCAFELKHELY